METPITHSHHRTCHVVTNTRSNLRWRGRLTILRWEFESGAATIGSAKGKGAHSNHDTEPLATLYFVSIRASTIKNGMFPPVTN